MVTIMVTIGLLLLVVAFVLFVMVAVGFTLTRFNLMAAGLACWVLSEILAMFAH
jgi:hypothetical protein